MKRHKEKNLVPRHVQALENWFVLEKSLLWNERF